MTVTPATKTGLGSIVISPDAILSFLAISGLVFIPAIGTPGALLFLISGVALIIRHARIILSLCWKNAYLLALPAFCLLSAAWSLYPSLTLRFSLQLLATVLIAILIATTISSRTFSRSLFILYSTAMVLSVLIGDVRNDIGAWLGIYGSKNALAGAAATYIIVCTTQILDSSADRRYRLLATFGFMLGMMLLLLAQSVSAVALLPAALTIQFLLLVLYRLTPVQRIVSLSFLALSMALVATLIAINIDAIVGMFLETTGKDVTLTGRTDLWRTALDHIAENPLFGMGYQAFWVQGHNAAEALWYAAGIESRSGFNFHNMYLSNAVEVGIIGVLIQIFILFGSAILTGLWAIRTRQADAALMFILVMMVIMISLIEVPVFFQFSLRTVIVICAFVFAVRGLRDHRQSIMQYHAQARRR